MTPAAVTGAAIHLTRTAGPAPSPRRKPAKTPRSVAEYAKWFASQGGKARVRCLNAEERRAIGKKGAEAWWGRSRKPQK